MVLLLLFLLSLPLFFPAGAELASAGAKGVKVTDNWTPAAAPGEPAGVRIALAEAENTLRCVWFVRGVSGTGASKAGATKELPRMASMSHSQSKGPAGRRGVSGSSGAQSSQPTTLRGIVQYGDAPDRLSHTARASSVPVNDYECTDRGKKVDTCVGGDLISGRLFTADMTALFASSSGPAGGEGSKTLHYRVGVTRDPNDPHFGNSGNDAPSKDTDYVWSEIFAVPLRHGASPVDFVAYGDMGTAENQPNAPKVAHALAADRRVVEGAEFILHAGDLAYSFTDHSRWAQWLEQMQPVLGRVPYMPARGNRDDVAIVDTRFRMPLGKQTAENRNRYFSFDRRFVHVTAIDCLQDFAPNSPQYAWIETDLREASAARLAGKTAWIVVMGHTPFYSSSAGHDGGDPALREHIEPLFRRFGVDVYIFGDDHAYERSWPMYGGKVRLPKSDASGRSTHWAPASVRFGGGAGGVSPNAQNRANTRPVDTFVDATGLETGATVHMLVGTAGCGLDPWTAADAPPAWSASREISHGYTRIEATPAKFRVQFVRAPGGEIGDEFVLESTTHGLHAEHYGFSSGGLSPGGRWAALVLISLAGFVFWRWRRAQAHPRGGRLGVSSAYSVK
jgi:Calcineurin-like phosphoesterase/Iron/zinc purple acid phosphatase-like protein C